MGVGLFCDWLFCECHHELMHGFGGVWLMGFASLSAHDFFFSFVRPTFLRQKTNKAKRNNISIGCLGLC